MFEQIVTIWFCLIAVVSVGVVVWIIIDQASEEG